MPYHNPLDPGNVNRWKDNVAKGVRRSFRHCPACQRQSNTRSRHLVAERLAVWRCRYCGHEVVRTV